MKSNRLVNPNNFSSQSSLKATPDSQMLSRQIENLRVVVRRMKTSDSAALDSLINQKLKAQP